MTLIRTAYLEAIKTAVPGQSEQLSQDLPEPIRTRRRLQSYCSSLGDPYYKRIGITGSIQAFRALSRGCPRSRRELQKSTQGVAQLECLPMIGSASLPAFLQ